MLSNLYTLEYYALSPPHSALMHHRLVMLVPPHPHRHHHHPHNHIPRHHLFPGQTYYTLSPPHSALIHHWLAMILPSHPHPHRRHLPPHTCRHHWFADQTSRVQWQPVVTGWRWGWHHFCHLHLPNPRCPLASLNAVRHACNCCLLGCLDKCFRSLRGSNCQQE